MSRTVYQSIPGTPDPVVILGARTFAREVADLVSDLPAFALKGFVENLDRERCSASIDGLPVHWVDDLPSLVASHKGICALGSTDRRSFIEHASDQGLGFITLVHPSGRVSSRSTVGEGSIICPGVQVASHARIGRHVLINRGALIGHNVEIGDYVTIGPGVNIAGFCRIGSGTFVGMGATLIEKVAIGEGAVVGACAVVRRDVPDHVMVAGTRAMVVKRGVNGL